MIRILERSALRSARIGYCLVGVIDMAPAVQQRDGEVRNGVVRVMAHCSVPAIVSVLCTTDISVHAANSRSQVS